MTRRAVSATTPRSWVIRMTAGAELALQFDDQFEDLRLDGDVERRGRLVGDQHLGIAGERHGDHGALAHAARELVRIFLGALRRLGDAHQVEHLDGALEACLAVHVAVQDQRLGDLLADGHHRIERRHRLLEDHRDLVAAHAAHLFFADLQEVAAAELDRARDDAARRIGDEPHQRQRRHALAAARIRPRSPASRPRRRGSRRRRPP